MSGKSLKLKPLTKADIIKNVSVYVANFIIIVGFFIATIAIDASSLAGFKAYFDNLHKFFTVVVLIALCCFSVAVYLIVRDRNFFKEASNSEMLFLIIELSLIICYVAGKYLSFFSRPLAFAALITLFLTGSRKSIFMNFIFALILFVFDVLGLGVYSSNPVNCVFFLVIGVASGFIATWCMDNVSSRLKLLLMSLFISLPIFVSVAVQLTGLTGTDFIIALACGFTSGPFAAVVLMIFLPIFEAMFKKVSCFKLAEYTDHKSKLIRKLILEAPGTFNHSITVANIAEACAVAIGEDGLLARTCAYYHDVGKLRRAEFFTENQTGNEDFHNDLMPELSANIIRSHAIDGYNYVLKNGMPKDIADVCLQHHGTMPIVFFYDKAKKLTDGEVDVKQFCYPGPKPQTKIAAIIMIADSCEAITRTLKDRSVEKVSKAVRKVVNDRMSLGQFDECEITLKEINIIIHTVINSLTGVYHSRIEYPKISLEGLDIDEKEGQESDKKEKEE